MTDAPTNICKHCGEPIKSVSPLGWLHEDGTYVCKGGFKFATPKEKVALKP